MRESRIPEFYIYSTLRALLDAGLVAPVALEQKKLLGEKLRSKFQLERAAEVFRSILADEPNNIEVRKRLIVYLERARRREELDDDIDDGEGSEPRGLGHRGVHEIAVLDELLQLIGLREHVHDRAHQADAVLPALLEANAPRV